MGFGEKRKEMKAKRLEAKELRITQKEIEAVGQLTAKLMQQENLTYEQVWECYE